MTFLELIGLMDCTAVLYPHNKDTTRAGPVTDLQKIQPSKVKQFFDHSAETWGAMDEVKYRLTMSFYLQTDEMSPNLKEAHQNPLIKEHLSTTGRRLTLHVLPERADKDIRFFVAKAMEHTWRDGMAERLATHLRANGVDVPVAMRDNAIKAEGRNAHNVSVFVGSKDAAIVEKTLLKSPFQGCELLFQCSKKTNPTAWQQTSAIHKQLS